MVLSGIVDSVMWWASKKGAVSLWKPWKKEKSARALSMTKEHGRYGQEYMTAKGKTRIFSKSTGIKVGKNNRGKREAEQKDAGNCSCLGGSGERRSPGT